MSVSNEELSALLTNLLAKLHSRGLKESAWLAIALSHPELELSRLRMIANQLNCNDNDLFQLLTILGNTTHLTAFVSEQPAPKVLELIKYDNFSAYRWAAQNGHLEVLKHLESQAPGQIQAMIAADNFSAYRLAAQKGHLEVLKHLESQAPGQIQAMIAALRFSAYRLAAQKGHLEVLK